MKIKKISSRQILDSAGKWTIEVKLTLDNGSCGSACVPSGISEGQWEAKTVPAKQAIGEINDLISGVIINKDFDNQNQLDGILDKLTCGANATLPVSLAFCRAAKTLSFPQIISPPQILMLIFEGAKHGSEDLSIQEFMVIADKVQQGIDAYKKVEKYLKKNGLPITVGAEGGFSPPGLADEEVLKILKKVLGKQTKLALDVAADFHTKNKFDYPKLIKKYPIKLIEDPFADDDWQPWCKLNLLVGNKVLIVGDDLTAASPERIKEAIAQKAIGGVMIKPDQRKTLTEVLEAIKVAKDNNLKVIIGHRGRETNDSFIADLAVAVQADFVKFGAPARGERVAKYNRLLELAGKALL